MVAMQPTSRVSSSGMESSPKHVGRVSHLSFHPEPLPEKLIQKPFQIALDEFGYDHVYPSSGILSQKQREVLGKISVCKTPDAGFTVYKCSECGHLSYNYNKCKDRNCPICQNLKTLVWADNRSVEVIDAPYYHVVMTVPHELNAIIYQNQKALYGLLHRSLSSAIVELARDEEYMGGTPGIIQVLHTWDQELQYHVHVHAIVSGAGLTADKKLVQAKSGDYLFPVKVLSKVVKGRFMDALKAMYEDGHLKLKGDARKLTNHYEWKELLNTLYSKEWVSYIKDTFNGNGNAIDYLARYTNKVAIGNSRIRSVTADTVTFTVRGADGKQSETRTLSVEEFVGRYLMHVLPSGFQKVRYYGFLANGCRKKNLAIIFGLQERQQFLHRYREPKESEVLRVEFHVDLGVCSECGKSGTMKVFDGVRGILSWDYIPEWEQRERRRCG